MSNKLDAFFPGTVSDDTFLSQTLCRLATQGIDASTSVACIAACHDMVRQPLLQRIRETWPTTFDYTALAAVPTVGETGGEILVHAARQSPDVSAERPQIVVFVLPHVAIDADCSGCFTLARLLDELRVADEWGLELGDLELVRLRKRVWLQCDRRQRRCLTIEELAKLTLQIGCSAAWRIVDGARQEGARVELVSGLIIETRQGARVWAPQASAST
ncbi:MAG: hypothetical protein KC503_41185 [Myxococcales bacterium]|nr:hypothetical protein [Myxococcales bacterium]